MCRHFRNFVSSVISLVPQFRMMKTRSKKFFKFLLTCLSGFWFLLTSQFRGSCLTLLHFLCFIDFISPSSHSTASFSSSTSSSSSSSSSSPLSRQVGLKPGHTHMHSHVVVRIVRLDHVKLIQAIQRIKRRTGRQ